MIHNLVSTWEFISLVNTKEVIQCFQHDMHVGDTS
jgi:hypothetical protein